MIVRISTILLFFMFGCSHSDVHEEGGEIPLDDHLLINPKIIVYRDSQKVIETNSQQLTKSNDDTQGALLTGNVVAHFFNEFGEHVSILQSDSARVEEITNNFEAYGHVIVKSDSGLTLQTNRIFWDHRNNYVFSKDSVMFTTSQMDTLIGTGFTSDIDLSNYTVNHPVGSTSRSLKK